MTTLNKKEMALMPIEKSMPNGVKRLYEAPVGNLRNFGRYNFRNKKFNRGSNRDRVRDRWSENRARESSGRNTTIGGRVQSTLQSVMKLNNTIPPCPKCTKRHL